jgi:hypothetical protein
MVWFAHDSALEGTGFELPVPRQIGSGSPPVRPMVRARPVRPKDVFPPTRIEQEYVAEARDGLWTKANELGHQAAERVREMAFRASGP